MTLEWISVIAAVVSAIAAISSLGWAAKANQKANKANKIAKDSLELTYRQSLEEHPNSLLQIHEVVYIDFSPASTSEQRRDPVIGVVMEGTLTNLTDQELLVTSRPLSRYENEFRREGVIEIGGKTGNTLLGGKQTVRVRWENRQKLEYWKKLLAALTPDRDVKYLPKTWLDAFKEIIDDRAAADKFSYEAGFEIITETRATERIATHWILTPRQSAVKLRRPSEEVVLENPSIGPIDDDIAKYRWKSENGLARLFRPLITHLHGREE